MSTIKVKVWCCNWCYCSAQLSRVKQLHSFRNKMSNYDLIKLIILSLTILLVLLYRIRVISPFVTILKGIPGHYLSSLIDDTNMPST